MNMNRQNGLPAIATRPPAPAMRTPKRDDATTYEEECIAVFEEAADADSKGDVIDWTPYIQRLQELNEKYHFVMRPAPYYVTKTFRIDHNLFTVIEMRAMAARRSPTQELCLILEEALAKDMADVQG